MLYTCICGLSWVLTHVKRGRLSGLVGASPELVNHSGYKPRFRYFDTGGRYRICVGWVVEVSIRGVGFLVVVEPEVETVLVRVVDAVAPRLVPADVEPTPRCVSDAVVDMDL